MTNPTFSLKPLFIGWLVLIQQLPFHLFLTVWGGVLFGAMINDFVLKNDDLAPMVFLVCGSVFFILTPLIIYFGKKLNYNSTSYEFHDDKIEFTEGFLTINQKVIQYRDIREVSLRRGIIQRACGLGTIYLATLATGTSSHYSPFSALHAFGLTSISASGIMIRDIQDPDKNYARIRTLIELHHTK